MVVVHLFRTTFPSSLEGKSAWKTCRSPTGALAPTGFLGARRRRRAGEPLLLLAWARGDGSSHSAELSRRHRSKRFSFPQESGGTAASTEARRSPSAMETLPLPKMMYQQAEERSKPGFSELPFLGPTPPSITDRDYGPIGLKPSFFRREFLFTRENLEADSKTRSIQRALLSSNLTPRFIS